MVEVPAIILEKINNFLDLLNDNNIRVIKAYLFGSYSKGNYDEWSDIDLAIISNDFTGNSFQDKINLIDFIYQTGKEISPLPFKEEDFENNLFAQTEIKKNGIVIQKFQNN